MRNTLTAHAGYGLPHLPVKRASNACGFLYNLSNIFFSMLMGKASSTLKMKGSLMKQLRVYTLKNEESAKVYFSQHWPKHMISLPKFGIFINNVYLGCNEKSNQVMAVVTFPHECDIQALNEKYMNSPEFREDMHGFNMTDIVRVDEFSIGDTLF